MSEIRNRECFNDKLLQVKLTVPKLIVSNHEKKEKHIFVVISLLWMDTLNGWINNFNL